MGAWNGGPGMGGLEWWARNGGPGMGGLAWGAWYGGPGMGGLEWGAWYGGPGIVRNVPNPDHIFSAWLFCKASAVKDFIQG